jgi:hypothetical protein
MRRHHPRWAVVFIVSLVAAAVGEFPRQSLAQNPDGDGHSYMHIVIGDHVLTNFGPNANYQKGGWLAIDSVAVKSPGQTHVYRGNTDRLPKGWVFLSAKMKSGHHGPGTLSFGVGDSGGLDPTARRSEKWHDHSFRRPRSFSRLRPRSNTNWEIRHQADSHSCRGRCAGVRLRHV